MKNVKHFSMSMYLSLNLLKRLLTKVKKNMLCKLFLEKGYMLIRVQSLGDW